MQKRSDTRPLDSVGGVCEQGPAGRASAAMSDRLRTQQTLVAVVGPTAGGKTELALRIAARVGGEIIGCDALQIRGGLPLLTAKPTQEELSRAPHHLIGVLPPDEPATAARYAELADAVIADIVRRGRVPVVCGGTGLYLRALRDGLFAGPAGDRELREKLRAEAGVRGVGALHAQLMTVDPAAAARIGPADYVRIERALEVFLLTGRPISDWQEDSRRDLRRGPRYRILHLGLDPGHEELRRRIARRAAAMLQGGVITEVEASLATNGLPRFPPLGFSEIERHLSGELTREALLAELIAKTAQYARRQRTWFRSEPMVRWATAGDEISPDAIAAELAATADSGAHARSP